MFFNFRLLIRLVGRIIFSKKESRPSFHYKRLTVVLTLFILYPLCESLNWLCFLLDDIFYPGNRHTPVEKPLFIVGVPRSGTTFLHRLLARDSERFTSIRFWELLLAPSVVQKKAVVLLCRIDRALGGHGERYLRSCESRLFSRVSTMHRFSLFAAEEDEFLLVHMFATPYLFVVFPFVDELLPYIRFDEELPERLRRRIMHFYRRCIQKHLYVFGKGRRLLSKNPAFSTKILSITEAFPDAQIICTVRSPLDVLPSQISLVSHILDSFQSSFEQHPARSLIYEATAYLYRYSAEKLESLPEDRRAFVLYADLTADPETTVRGLYGAFGLPLSRSFAAVLASEAQKARNYTSKHSYSLESAGLSREQVVSDYRDIFKRFGFSTGEADAAAKKPLP